MAVTPIYPVDQNFSTPLMATPNPEYGLKTQGMQQLGKGLGQALMRQRQAQQARQLASAASGGPIIPGGMNSPAAMLGANASPGGAPVSPQAGADMPAPDASPSSAAAPTGPVPTPQQMTPPPGAGGLAPQGGGMGFPAAGITAQGGNMGYPALGIPGQSALGFNSAGGDTPASELDAIKAGIAKVESGGNYNAVGPDVHGDHAYGKYQVMGANIPSWTSEALGYSETPQQFLHDPGAQEGVASVKMGEYLAKYGDPQDVSSMWFAGRPASRSHGLSDGNMKADQYIAATVGNLGAQGGQRVAANMPSPDAQPMAGRLPPDPNGGFSLPGGGSAPSPQGGPAAAPAGALGGQIDPRIQERLQGIMAVALNPYADPQTRQMAMQMYEQQMQFALPHPMTWQTIPGTNDQRQMDWLGRPTGQVLHGGGANGQNANVPDKWVASTYTDLMGQQHIVETNERTGEQRFPSPGGQGGGASLPVAPGMFGSPMGAGPQLGNARGAPAMTAMPTGAPQSPVGGSLGQGGLPPFSGLSGSPGAPARPPQAPPATIPSSQGPGMGLPAMGIASQPNPGTPPNAANGGVVAMGDSGLPKQIMPLPGDQPAKQYPTQEQYEQNLDHALEMEKPMLIGRTGITAEAADMVLGQARDIMLGKRPDPSTFQGMAGSKPQDMAIEMAVSDLTKGFDPTFSSNRYAAMQSFGKDNGPTTPGGMMQFGRTMMHHLNQAAQNSDNLTGVANQSNIPVIGPLINDLRNAVHPAQTGQYELDVRALGDEMNKFYNGGGGTKDERDLLEGAYNRLQASRTPDERRAALNEMSQLVKGKVMSLQSRWHDAVGGLPDYSIFDANAENDLNAVQRTQKIGGQGPVHMGSGENPPITQKDMDYLRGHPEKAAQFDKHFGPGASKYVLGR